MILANNLFMQYLHLCLKQNNSPTARYLHTNLTNVMHYSIFPYQLLLSAVTECLPDFKIDILGVLQRPPKITLDTLDFNS